jgi:LCP family protein required for cell wall assembly
MKKALKVIAIVLIMAIIIGGTGVYFYLKSFSLKNDGNESLIPTKESKSGEPINVLLLGMDIGTVDSKNSPKRSDTMMVIHYEPKLSEVSIVSIPRDTRVKLNGSYDKINAASVYGGVELSIKTVEDMLGIPINYYAAVEYEGFRALVDAVGGIDVVIPFDMDYDAESQNLHIHFKKGKQTHLDGENAEKFIRWRKNNDGTGYAEGDIGRIKTQQEFMVKIFEKVKTLPVTKMPSIAKMLPEYIETNMSPMTMLNLAKDIPKIKTESIQKFTLNGESKRVNGIWYFLYEPEQNADIIAHLGWKTSGVKEENINPKDINVQIFNGSGIDGAASKLGDQLGKKGYNVISVGNISGVEMRTSHIIDRTLKRGYASQVSEETDIGNIKKDQDSLSKADIVVIIGLDKQNVLK